MVIVENLVRIASDDLELQKEMVDNETIPCNIIAYIKEIEQRLKTLELIHGV